MHWQRGTHGRTQRCSPCDAKQDLGAELAPTILQTHTSFALIRDCLLLDEKQGFAKSLALGLQLELHEMYAAHNLFANIDRLLDYFMLALTRSMFAQYILGNSERPWP
jgi:hypothetical protein